mmetsp:Transcript_25391/g.55236  ORF Transcript_25391/g.55236 Transcript_25391/m.55236 type:complete len:615 (+) Transcript_25391:172-2016(+)|eukprot:CAMPEP_0206459494 /NCGR_PEP_ID=MMETSP0324_2-20121206/24204_1 /ASSEMBLY_ACC=CAM_ASM_000836 /TAXON_ID=2866 /ORGANISM="Crypthecodinium cohnii, Strain Seligo" /LENGTH=614 /DNA_ID=CAMNT_0053931045 /DNA_START=167 /DNA_END=2011 /DNA_ORIENTATION=+
MAAATAPTSTATQPPPVAPAPTTEAEATQVVKEALGEIRAAIASVTGPDGPFPLREEEFEHFGTKQKYLTFYDGPNSIVYHTVADMYKDCFSRNLDKPFLVYEGERLTYGDVWQRASALARVLADDYGMQRGDCIAIAGRNTPDWVIAFVAVTGFLSCVALPVNSWWVDDELKYGLQDSGAKLLLADAFVLSRAPFLEELKVPAILMRGNAKTPLPKGTRVFKDLLAEGLKKPAFKQRPVAKEDTALLMYTSGTTSNPKGVVMTHRSAAVTMNGYRVLLSFMPPPAGEGNQAVILVASPLFHVNGTHVALFAAMCLGAKLCMMFKWEAKRALEIIQEERVNNLVGVPTNTYDIANYKDLHKYDTSSLAAVGGGGANFAAPMIKRVNDTFKTAKAGTGFGMTETNAISCVMPGALFPLRPTSCGLPMFHLETIILDENNKKLPPGQMGEICLRGAQIMKEYWGKPDKTAEVFHFDEDGKLYFRTGDLGMLDEDGLMYITDRAKDIIIRGGENISCGEVEHAIYDHPSIAEVAAVGMPDETLGEVVAVAVVVKPGEKVPTPQELKAVAAKKLAGFKVPAEVYVWPDALPRGATGKIQKRDIRDKLKAQRGGPQSKL